MTAKSKRRSLILPIVLVILSLGIIIGTSLAYFTDARSTSNPVDFGKIEISDGESIIKEVALTDALPGDAITSDVSFSKAVDSEAMYIRVKIAYTTESQEQAIQDLVNEMNGYDLNVSASDTANYKWSDRYGSYYYLLDATTSNAYSLDTLEEITLSNGFIIPRELEQLPDYAQYYEVIKLVIEIQAVQSANVTDNVEELDIIFTELFGESAEFPPYTFGQYDSDSAFVDKYYVDIGEYPQSLASVTASDVTATSEQITVYNTACTVYQNNTTDDRYVLYNSNYYLIEPVRWIILDYEEGYDTSTYNFDNFTIDGQTAYVDTAKTTPYTGTNGQPGLLLLSEKVLNRSVFDSNYDVNQYSISNLKVVIDRMCGEIFTASQQNFVKSITVKSTYNDGFAHYGGDVVTTKLFPLSYKPNTSYTDEYAVQTYFTSDTQRVGLPTALAVATGLTVDSDTGGVYWWMRSGAPNTSFSGWYITASGTYYGGNVYLPFGVRVACIVTLD